MCSTGLLIAETSSNLKNQSILRYVSDKQLVATNSQAGSEAESNGIVAMLDKTLGFNAKAIGGLLYVFLHYSLLVAYIAEAGEVLNETILLPLQSQFHLPAFIGPLLFTSSLGGLFILTSTRTVENVNNFFVLIVLLTFISLIIIGFPLVANNVELQMASTSGDLSLLHQDYTHLIPAVPVMLLALVYHNIIPTICNQMQYDKKYITTVLSVGTLIPLIMFLLWNFLIIGLIPVNMVITADATTSSTIDPVNVLISSFSSQSLTTISSSSSAMTESFFPTMLSDLFSIPTLISVFSEAAIITSFIGFVFGLSDFFRDLFPKQFGSTSHVSSSQTQTTSLSSSALSSSSSSLSLSSSWKREGLLYSTILVPPLLISINFPDIFTEALSFAGTYGICILFCIFPAAMALSARSASRTQQQAQTPTSSSLGLGEKEIYDVYVPGGDNVLYGIISFASIIILQESFFK